MEMILNDKHVLDLICAVASDELIPRFRRLASSEIFDKNPGEIVTVADLAAEAALSAGLLKLLPGSIVVGEEASHRDPTLLEQINGDRYAWLVDPLDGTKHFADGQESWGVMVALVRLGQVEAAWIHLPLANKTVWGRQGESVFLNSKPVKIPGPPSIEDMRGAMLTRFLPPELKATVDAEASLQRTDSHHQCAAQRYVDILSGYEHFALYYRTLAWDHAPGAFLVQQAGAVVKRFDGSRYNPGDERHGLLIAANQDSWLTLHDRLLPQIPVKVDQDP
jgi:fructose-1,6-bisphosphatase/inositol monophosphatase family enzyme